ncbi:MAG: SRPBCC family protein [Steroidobacteraceae bacterium]|nr:SRPBCC family protein [Steroidobacteraceae bacterium]
MSTDRIEKQIVLRASRERVWRAIADSTQFGKWFGVSLQGPFLQGQRVAGRIVATAVDPEVAKLQEPWVGMACDFYVDRIEPMDRFSFRWHPGAEEAGPDAPEDQMTTVTFELKDAPGGGVLLTITETGFDRIPLERRAKVFADNEGGWEMQIKLIEKYLAQHANG